jgi:hypothetical protein
MSKIERGQCTKGPNYNMFRVSISLQILERPKRMELTLFLKISIYK